MIQRGGLARQVGLLALASLLLLSLLSGCDAGEGEAEGEGSAAPECLADADCADDDPCTLDTCTPEGQQCRHALVEGCCRQDTECRTGSQCLVGRCDPQTSRCTAEPVPDCCTADDDCPAPDPCQQGRCDLVSHTCVLGDVPGCCQQDGDCPSGDPCQAGRCDPDTRTCQFDAVPGCCAADDDCPTPADPCQAARCDLDTHGCVLEPVPDCCTQDDQCPGVAPCVAGRCDRALYRCVQEPVPGCCAADEDCPFPAEPCLARRCDPATHTCGAEPLPDCCTDDALCPDAPPCQAGRCDEETHACTLDPVPGCCTGDEACLPSGPCQAASCDLATHRCVEQAVPGCCTADADCPGVPPCQVGRCDDTAHLCTLEPIPGCCASHADCPAADPCQLGRCDDATHACVFLARQRCCQQDAGCAAGLRCATGVSFCARPLHAGDLVITELLLQPGVGGVERRWLEVHNPGEAAVFLNGLQLTLDEGPTHVVDAADPLLLPGGAFAVLGTSADPLVNGGVVTHYADAALPLPAAAGGTLRLGDPFGTLLDEVPLHPLLPVPAGASWSLTSERTAADANDLLTAWCASPTPWAEGTDRGSPGQPNPPCPPVVDEDGDGWPAGVDCDDADRALNHDDGDGDGATTCAGDCDDADPQRNLRDADGDEVSTCAGDCDDEVATVRPGLPDVCGNEVDDDCDGLVDVGPGCPLDLRIEEVVPDLGDDDGPGVFIELRGRPGLALDAFRLIHRDTFGTTVGELALAGQRVGPDGFFVVAHPQAAAALAAQADVRDPLADLLDDHASLQLGRGEQTVDALAWGTPQRFLGEGRPARRVAAGHALSRMPEAPDTSNNLKDFIEAAPSPRGLLPVVDWAASLQPAARVTLAEGETIPVLRGAVREDGRTGGPDAPAGLWAEAGYGPEGTLPGADGRWRWQLATFQQVLDGAAQYEVQLGDPAAGWYQWCFRFSLDGVYWSYADLGPAGTTDGYQVATAGEIVVGACDESIDRDADGTPCPADCDDGNRLLHGHDQDGDGFSPCDGDCDDDDPARTPADRDEDGESSCAGDCDDDDPARSLRDGDGDGYATCAGDCADDDPQVFPGAAPVCGDGRDNDCDGQTDDPLGECLQVRLLIDEVYPDEPGPDGPAVFVALWGEPTGASLRGFSLVSYQSSGSVDRSLDLGGQKLGEDGYLLIAHPSAAAPLAGLADLLDPLADGVNAGGALQLRHGEQVRDALAWGEVPAGQGEGAPAARAPEGLALTRLADHGDTDDNGSDFFLEAPTPRGAPPAAGVTFAALREPLGTVTVDAGRPLPQFMGQVRVPGRTPGPGPGRRVEVQLCRGPEHHGPSAWPEEWCVPASYAGDITGATGEPTDDLYAATFAEVEPGRYPFAFRFRADRGEWVWGDAAPAGSDDGFDLATAGLLVVDPCDPTIDQDGDGSPCPDDCDDHDPTRDARDQDEDGFATCDGDCDDDDPDRSPADLDGDGFTSCDGDCDDDDPDRTPADLDGDGHSSCDGDCDDDDPATHPGAALVCDDGIDNDCDGQTDDAARECLTPWLLVNEVYPDEPGPDGPNVFVELWGGPGDRLLRDVRLERHRGDGTLEAVLDLDGVLLPPDGYLVIATESARDPLAAMVDLHHPLGDSLNAGQSLRLLHGETLLDALAWGSLDAPRGEGTPAPLPVLGSSLTRSVDHGDTGDNASDFVESASPSPGRATASAVTFAAWREPPGPFETEPGEATPLLLGQVHAVGRTPGAGPGPGVEAELCHGPRDSDPVTWPGVACVPAAYARDLDGPAGLLADDGYQAALTLVEPGAYDLAFRFRVDRGPWTWADAWPAGSADGYLPADAAKLVVGPCDLAHDRDGDGTPCVLDCDDTDPLKNQKDTDEDGYSTCDGDCDDDDPARTPADRDDDGYSTCDDDCDDDDATRHPGDDDGDGFSPCDDDCDDLHAAAYPAAPLVCGDGLDNDCDGATDDLARECLPARLLINEVYADEPGPDGPFVFVELWGTPPDRTLGDVVLERHDADGAPDGTLDLTGLALGEDGFLLLAHPAADPSLALLADLLDPLADARDDGQSLRLVEGGLVHDALAYGAVGVGRGEGRPAPAAAPGHALSRRGFTDTGDNLLDFHEATPPSPRAEAGLASIGYAALRDPLDPLTLLPGQLWVWTGQVHVADRTPGPGQGPGIDAQLCSGPRDTDPATWAPTSCGPAEYGGDLDGTTGAVSDDVYVALLARDEPGDYDVAFRFRVDDGPWVWGDRIPGGSTDGYHPADAGKLRVKADDPVTIQSFTALPAVILAGEEVTLTWQTAGATSLQLTANGLPVDLQGQPVDVGTLRLVLEMDTTFVLVAGNDLGNQVQATATVTVQPRPRIRVFTAQPDQLVAGDATTLTWQTTGATSLTLLAGDEPVDLQGQPVGQGQVTDTPDLDTTYTLVARDDLGHEAVATLTVQVFPRPEIVAFVATPGQILVGETSELSWETTAATEIRLTDDQGEVLDLTGQVASSGRLTVHPEVTRTYTLTATGALGSQVQATVLLPVWPRPEIHSFTTTRDRLCAGSSTTLAWEMANTTGFNLRDPLGNLVETSSVHGQLGELQLIPETSGLWTLTAEGALGATVSAQVTVTVDAVPVIEAFTASPESSVSGQPVTLTWQTSGATSLVLTADGQPVDLTGQPVDGGTVVVKPQIATSYQLVARTAYCQASTPTVDVDVSAARLQLSEVLYDPTGEDGGRQWVEIYNAGDTVVDLGHYSLGAGYADYTNTRIQLQGRVPPGGCFVVGGPVTDPDNGSPILDQPIDFAPVLMAPPLDGATGIALFFSPADQIAAASRPIDALVIGTANTGNLLDEAGQPAPVLVTGAAEASLHRFSDSPKVWQPMQHPTPGRCWALASDDTPLVPNWGSQGGQSETILRGFGLRPEMFQIDFGSNPASCVPIPEGLRCTTPQAAAAGYVELGVTQVKRAAQQGDEGIFVELEPEEYLHEIYPGGYRYDWCQVQPPEIVEVARGNQSAVISTHVLIVGITTDGNEPGDEIIVQVGRMATEQYPNERFNYLGNWYKQIYTSDFNDIMIDEFQGFFLPSINDAPADYWIFSRVSSDSGLHWMYCDFGVDGNSNGINQPGYLVIY